MGDAVQYDLCKVSFQDFVKFLFDHEPISIILDNTQPFSEIERSSRPEPWYFSAEILYDPVEITSHYIHLFSSPGFLINEYSPQQLEQGFWAVHGGALDCSVDHLIWDDRIHFEMRESCVRSMFYLFNDLFSKVTLDTAPNMWWDSLAYDWCCGNRNRVKGGEDASMQDVMFETLQKILFLPSEKCQYAALHGLGHLHHPDTKVLIDKFISQTAGITDDMEDYALDASRFDVM